LIKTHRERLKTMLQEMGWEFGPRVDRASGD
jgi:hypothetical protein